MAPINKHRLTAVVGAAAAAVLAATSVASGSPATALKETETRGAIYVDGSKGSSVKRLESVGRYSFRGRTTPSRKGQRVVFKYRRLHGDDWRRFGTPERRPAFYDQYRERHAVDRVNRRGRWTIDFVPYRTGRFVLRATFPRQDGFGRSGTRERVKVVGEGA